MSAKVPAEYFKKHLNWLTILGIDVKPVESEWYRSIYRIYACSFLFCVYSYSILELIEIVRSSDFNSITFGLTYFVTHILGAVKITIFVVRKKKVRQMLLELESGYFIPNNERGGAEEFRLVNTAIKRTNVHAKIFNTFVYCIIGIRCLYAFFDKGTDKEYYDEYLNTTVYTHIRTLPYKAWLPVDLNQSPAFELMFFYQASSLIVYGYYIGFIDSIIYGLMIHMKTQFLILQSILNRYVTIAKDQVLKKNKNMNTEEQGLQYIKFPKEVETVNLLTEPVQEKVKDIVHYCAGYHTEIIHYCDKIESEFSYLMLVQFLSSLYILCLQLFQLSLMQNFLSFDFISMCLYLTLMMYQLFCYCWYGNEIMIQSSDFSMHVYNTQWLVTSDSAKKSLLLMMMRAQRPISFTAGKFALLSLPTYMTIVRGSASYFMVLRQMNG